MVKTNREKAIDVLCTGRSVSFYYARFSKREIIERSGPCHRLFSDCFRRDVGELQYFATNCSACTNSHRNKITEEMAREWFAFISSEKSPWAVHFQGDYEVVENNGAIRGVIFDPEVLPKLPIIRWFDVALFLRQAGWDGFPSFLSTWYYLTREGVDPILAIPLSHKVKYDKETLVEVSCGSGHITGYPVWTCPSVLKTQTPNENAKDQHSLWRGKKEIDFSNLLRSSKNIIKGRFAQLETLDKDRFFEEVKKVEF